jgi:guanylate kinase
MPPSLELLEQRLRGRSTDSEDVIKRRLGDARSDMTHWDEFDYVVINDDLEAAVAALQAILGGKNLEDRTDSAEVRRQAAAIAGK